MSGARERIGFAGKNSRELNPLFINHRVKPGARSVIRMNMELLAPLGVPADAPAIAVYPDTARDAADIRDWRANSSLGAERFLILDPFAGWETKLWPAENWIETARLANEKLGLRSMVFYGPGEIDHARQLSKKMPGAILSMETTLLQYVALLRQCAAAMVGGDTGPMHIAASLGVPTVALYGPSDPARNGPWFTGAKFTTLQDETQPCANTFARKCPHHQPGHCMDTLTPQMVVNSLSQLLENA
jgi:heptosyltransferase-1